MHNMLKIIFPPVHKEGYLFLFLFTIVSILLFSFSNLLGCVGFLATVWCFYFFRNPKRVVPNIEGLVVCPADGLVQLVKQVTWPKELTSKPKELGNNDKIWRISIFMNVFNIHVNRVPVSGKIKEVVYVPGKFLNASLDKASTHNERQLFVMEDKKSKKLIAFTQIAGLIARRITRETKKGDEFSKGQSFGMIRFGSRVDIFLPPQVVPLVCQGQTSVAGETILADLSLKKTMPTIGILEG